MSTRNQIRHEYSRTILERLPPAMRDPEISGVHNWWLSLERGNSLRLSREGKQMFDLVGMEAFEFTYVPKSNKTLLAVSSLNKFLGCPFYLEKTTITVYDSKVAMLITLYGSVDDYLDSLKR